VCTLDMSALTKNMSLLVLADDWISILGVVVQLEAFRELMQQVTKAQTADLEAIQKAQRVEFPTICP
jgi:hypothetical protein